ncbi:unnamed protein product [Spodoptera exigua]|uniref:Adenosine kinase n=1 Tax=Spodoptera exigua TaxID=7107 RepID=A0A835L7N9_SPOEX|nr:hypothetical protein HW555_002726 [Spodoptera exigua]CAH0694427.1 unnamed protein product [Spodoptera exigua]
MESYIMELFKDEVTECIVVGIGNPLLDISVMVDHDYLKKYDLKPNDAIMAEAKHLPLYKEIVEKFSPDYVAGGSVQNTTRVAQWILKKPNVCSYFGCVGNDEFAKILKDKAESDGVNVLYQVTTEKPTGTCAVLLTDGGNNRSLCANLAAAQLFTEDHIHKPECQAVIEKAKLIYSSGFFLAVSPEAMMTLAKHANEKNQMFALNVSAPFVMEFYKKQLEDVLPYVDILFGNQLEAEAFAKFFNLKATSIQEIALEIAKYPKVNKSRARVVVITRGSEPVILVNECKIEEIPVTPLKQEQIVDTNGAGDAFTGGFISQVVRGRPLKECVQCAIYAASHIIQNSGCSFRGPSEFKLAES